MPVPSTIKNKYSLNGDVYPSANADRAISDLLACIARINDEKERADARTLAAEGRLAEAITSEKALKNENERLRSELEELRAANQRITADAEKLDRRLAAVGVTATANDKRIAESSEHLNSLIIQAERLFSELETRTSKLCTELDRHAAALTDNIANPAADPDTADVAEEVDYIEVEEDIFENIEDTSSRSEPENISEEEGEGAGEEEAEQIEDSDDELDEDSDPNLFCEEDEFTDGTADIADARDGEADTTSSVSDDEIKNMLEAMYSPDIGSDENPSDTAEAEESDSVAKDAEETPQPQSASSAEYNNMRSSLDAIRRRLGK